MKPVSTKIVCPNCRVPAAAEDMNLATSVAKCRTCNHVFRFDIVPALTVAEPRPRSRMEKPRQVVVTDANGELTLRWRWFSRTTAFHTLMCAVWNVPMALTLRAGLPDMLQTGNAGVILGAILYVAIGIFFALAALTGYVNRTTVQINGRHLRVSHGPLPVWRERELDVDDVKQLFCEEKLVKDGKGDVFVSYNLTALLRDGSRKVLLSGIDAPDLPLYLEQHCERWMKITDEPVAGELAR